MEKQVNVGVVYLPQQSVVYLEFVNWIERIPTKMC